MNITLTEKKIKNKQNEIGLVTQFDGEDITVKYSNDNIKTYKLNIAFANGYLSFLDESINEQIKNEINKQNKQDDIKQAQLVKTQVTAVKMNTNIAKRYEELESKNYILKALFGKDFEYPPYKAFMKKYRLVIPKESTSWKWFGHSDYYDWMYNDYRYY